MTEATPTLDDMKTLILQRKPKVAQPQLDTLAQQALYIFNHPKYVGKTWMTPQLAIKLALFGGHEE